MARRSWRGLLSRWRRLRRVLDVLDLTRLDRLLVPHEWVSRRDGQRPHAELRRGHRATPASGPIVICGQLGTMSSGLLDVGRYVRWRDMNASAVSRTGWAGQFRSMVRSTPAGGTAPSGRTHALSSTGRNNGSGIADLQWHGRPTGAVGRGRRARLADGGRRAEGIRAVGNEVPLAPREPGLHPVLQECLGPALGAEDVQAQDVVELVGYPQHHGGLAEAVAVVRVAVGAPVHNRADGQQG